MNDTHPLVEQELLRRFQTLTNEERFKRGIALMNAGRIFARAAVKQRNPDLEGREFDIAVFRWIYSNSCPQYILENIK
jgi:hypothetical protein